MAYSYLLKLENGEPADPTAFVTDRGSWQPGDPFAARGGSRWRIVTVDTAPPLLAEQGFAASAAHLTRLNKRNRSGERFGKAHTGLNTRANRRFRALGEHRGITA